jgi:hypothetical protein
VYAAVCNLNRTIAASPSDNLVNEYFIKTSLAQKLANWIYNQEFDGTILRRDVISP